MFEINVLYVILNIILLFVYVYAGINISNGKNYIKNAGLCVTFYSLVYGFRYGRGDDYFHYQDLYLKGYDEGSQILFVLINDTLSFLGVNEYGFFGIYNFIEMTCGMLFLYKYRQYAKFLFPFFFIATIGLNENTIRQGLGYAFVFLCLEHVVNIEKPTLRSITKHKEDVIKIIMLFMMAYSIHSVCGYILVIMILSHLFIKKAIPISISIPVLLFSAYFFSNWFDFSWLNPILAGVAGNDERMAGYIDASDFWFNEEGMNTELYARKPVFLASEMLGTISLYYLGKLSTEKYNIKGLVSFYNFFVIGSIVLNAFRSLEILNRIGSSFSLFWFFPLTIIFFYRKKLCTTRLTKVAGLMLVWFFYDYFKYLFMRGDNTRFIWDI